MVSRLYNSFRGIDLREAECSLNRSPDCLNVYKDYTEIDSITTRPTLEVFESFDAPINAIYEYNGTILVHSGTSLYQILSDHKVLLKNNLSSKSIGFIYNKTFYFLSNGYYKYNGSVSEVKGYIPITSHGMRPVDSPTIVDGYKGGGEKYEDYNLLTSWRINSYQGDGTNVYYYLDTDQIDNKQITVRVDGEIKTNYSVNYDKGLITFSSPPPAPLTVGQDNVTIKFSKTIDGSRQKIEKCTLATIFDNRVFLSGNPDYPNYVWHSSLNEPEYISDLDYYEEGTDEGMVTNLVTSNNALWVFKEPNQSKDSIYYHTPSIDAEYGKIYPNSHSSVSIGCVGGAINFNDDIVFLSQNGLEGISGGVMTEQVASHRSSLIDRKLLTENLKNIIFCEWNGYLMLFSANRCYLADSRQKFTEHSHMEYDWYYFEFPNEITSANVCNGILFIGSNNTLYSLTGKGDIDSYWTTPIDKFGYPNYEKTTNKKGCVIEGLGDFTLYAKTEKTEFTEIQNAINVTDYTVARVKLKKFKDIQLKFLSHTRFNLQSVTLECFEGAYIKR